jgi:SAM-dependent methyltransferase
MGLDQRFALIKDAFVRSEQDRLQHKLPLFRPTSLGYWGVSNLDELFVFFSKIHLEKFHHFLDLGSGDGRMVFVASLFTRATGIEIDKELVTASNQLQKELIKKKAIIPKTCQFLQEDFMHHDLRNYDFLMSYYDKLFTLDIERKIQDEFTGDFYLYNNIYTPNFLKKEAIVWAGQMPFIKITIPHKK